MYELRNWYWVGAMAAGQVYGHPFKKDGTFMYTGNIKGETREHPDKWIIDCYGGNSYFMYKKSKNASR